jgi:outer membrane protein
MFRTAIALAVLGFTAIPAVAQDATRFGAVSYAYVARTSKAGQSAIAEINKFVKEKEAIAAAKVSEYEKQEFEARKSNSALLQKALERSRLDFERFQQDAQKEIEGMQAKFDADFRIKLAPIVEAISKEKGLHFVFGLEQAAIVWWSPAVDISAEVVKRLDAAKAP